MLLAALFASVLITADIRLNQMIATRAVLSGLVYPFYWLADLPARLGNWGGENIRAHSGLLEENGRLRDEALLLEAQVQQMAALRAENVRLRTFLNSSELVQGEVLHSQGGAGPAVTLNASASVQGRVLVAELVGFSPDPARHLVVLNKGSDDGVYIGQPLIDSAGLMGQVVEVSGGSARVLLLTDTTHAVPVQVNRNGVRAIAEGVGRRDSLVLRHVANTEDIVPGDILVSSGLGGRFPVGYRVAIVAKVERNLPGQAFARVTATPSAALNRSRHVLLVFTSRQGE